MMRRPATNMQKFSQTFVGRVLYKSAGQRPYNQVMYSVHLYHEFVWRLGSRGATSNEPRRKALVRLGLQKKGQTSLEEKICSLQLLDRGLAKRCSLWVQPKTMSHDRLTMHTLLFLETNPAKVMTYLHQSGASTRMRNTPGFQVYDWAVVPKVYSDQLLQSPNGVLETVLE